MVRHHHHHHRSHHSRRQIVIIPPSTASTIVFPYKQILKKFDTSAYNPVMTNGRASQEEIDQFLQEAVAPIEEWRNKQFFVKYPWAICVLIILLPLLYIMLFYMCCTSCKRQREYMEVLEKSRAIIKQNSASFEQRGLTWVTPTAYPYWIELWTGQQQMMQPMMMQPMMQQMQPMGQNGYNMVPMNMNNNLMPNQQGGFATNQYAQNNQFSNQQYGAGMYTGNNMNA